MKKSVKFQDAKLFFSDEGSGFPVVLIHGYLESSQIWGRFARELAKENRVISIDLPGHGDSEVIAEIHTMELMAESLQFLLSDQQIEKCLIFGHSMGGYVTMAFAELFPEMLTGYCLFHSTPFADNNEKKENRDREIELVKQGKKELIINTNIPKGFATNNLEFFNTEVKRVKEIALNTPEKGIVAILEGMKRRPDRSGIIKKSNISFLWILGKNDNYIDYNTIRPKIEVNELGALAVLDNSGHMGFIEELPIVLDVARDFISECMAR
ncbi:MAG: alpha/beta hydrolase [Bacteroidales bacterium]|nr:alpha/beta hydrolase [Bacteroidales bacterium]